MKTLIVVASALLLFTPAFATDMADRVERALKLPTLQEQVAQLEKEVKQGNLKAAHHLGIMYRDGAGVPRDPARALVYLERSARSWLGRYKYKLGLPESQYALAIMYRDGVGTERDMKAAVKWLSRAAEQGHGASQLALGEIYASPEAPTDFRQAYLWLAIAAGAWALDREEKEKAASMKEQVAGKLSPAELKEAENKVENWSPRRMI